MATSEAPSVDEAARAGGRRWRLERQSEPEGLIWYRVGALAVGLLLSILIMPFLTDQGSGIYEQVWNATLGTTLGQENVLTLATPLILTGLAVAIPYRVGLWNIGADGQMFLGAWFAALVAFSLDGLSGGLLIAMMILAAAVGGAVWALVPALARVYLGVNEIITTLLLNVVATLWMTYWAAGPWKAEASAGGVNSQNIPEQSEISGLLWGTLEIPTGFFLAAAVAIVVGLLFRYTTLGYATRVLGKSIGASTYAGIPARRMLAGMLIAGGLVGGLAGAIEMMGNVHKYSPALTASTGYTGVVVAVIAAGSAFGVLFIGVVFGGILVAGQALQVAGVSSNATLALVGMILFFAAIGDALARYRLVRGYELVVTRNGSGP